MKFFLMSSDESGNIDPTPLNQIFRRLPLTNDLSQCDAVVVPIAYFGNYKFNHNLTSLKKKILIFDFTEFGWQWNGQSDNVLGLGCYKNFPHLNTPEYAMLDKWAADFPAAVHFKRELRSCDKSETLLPVSFLCDIPAEPIQSKEEFNARPIEVFYNWGYSHPSRRRLHGEIFCHAHSKNIHILDSLDHGDRFEGARTWVTVHTPHYARKPMSHLMHWQRRAKITISMPGAGVTCFRSSEAPVNSVMAHTHSQICWPYSWFESSIEFLSGAEFVSVSEALERDFVYKNKTLYDLYLSGQETIDKYRPHRFIPEYVLPKIQERL